MSYLTIRETKVKHKEFHGIRAGSSRRHDANSAVGKTVPVEQQFQVEDNLVYQDNQAAILLEKNGRTSSGKLYEAY